MFQNDLPMMLLMLFVGHAVADYALQSDFIAQAKNRHTQLGAMFWKHVLPAHSLIHGGFVAIITGYWWLGLLETIIHFVTDYLKCENKISLNTDQFVHYGCKVVWFGIAFYLSTHLS